MFADPERYNRALREQIHRRAKRQNEILADLDEELLAAPVNGSTSNLNQYNFFDPFAINKE
jgi:hypothetical protein